MSGPPRRHRLPQRLDWALIPPPLDLSKPLVDDKAALPAIIVTPSSPSHSRDFRIAFLAPTPKEETMSERVFSRLNKAGGSARSSSPLPVKPRTLLLLFIPIFLLFCHFLAHRLGARHPHLHFDVRTQGGVAHTGDGSEQAVGWIDLNDYNGYREGRHAREFVTEETLLPSEQ